MPPKRTTIYIDGFNWYWGIFKDRPQWKWLNIQTFFQALRPNENIVAIHFCTALVHESFDNGTAQIRHLTYLDALSTLPLVKVVQGHYQQRRRRCNAICREAFQSIEEKQTDVNLVIAMMADLMDGITENICVVSGDTDIHPALRFAKARFPSIPITVYIPSASSKKHRRLDSARQIVDKVTFLPLENMERHQLPDTVSLTDGRSVSRPSTWR